VIFDIKAAFIAKNTVIKADASSQFAVIDMWCKRRVSTEGDSQNFGRLTMMLIYQNVITLVLFLEVAVKLQK
tara:strand:+ start:553536 stop:553751 length:216 start_codon:yes stop_codon:yes gene_type:complete